MMNKNMKLVVLGCVLMSAVAAHGETLPQVVQSVNNTISATAEENRKAVVQLGSQMLQEREQKQQKEAAAHDQQLVKAAKAQQADLRSSVQKTNYVATTYQAGPKYESLGDPFKDDPFFNPDLREKEKKLKTMEAEKNIRLCDESGGKISNEYCQRVECGGNTCSPAIIAKVSKLELAKQQCTNAQRDPRNESCQYVYESLDPGWIDRFQNRIHQLLMVNYDSQPDRRNYVLSTLPQYADQPAATTKQ